MLLATPVEPPELDKARGWYEKAAKVGKVDAMRNLGIPAGHPDGAAGAGDRPGLV